MSWNVLADWWSAPEWFPASPRELLEPGRRVDLTAAAVAELVAAHGVDVVGLQEVDRDTAVAVAGALPGWTSSLRLGGGHDPGTFLAVAPHLQVGDARAVAFTDGQGRPDRRHAHTAVVDACGTEVRVVVAHVHYAEPDVDIDVHPGVAAARTVVELSGDGRPAVLCADLNDLPGGPARRTLVDGGFDGCDDPTPTSSFLGVQPRALDVVATRRMARRSTVVVPGWRHDLPCDGWPSDHLAVVAAVDVLPSGS